VLLLNECLFLLFISLSTQSGNFLVTPSYIHALSGIRTHDPSVRSVQDHTWLKPRSHLIKTKSRGSSVSVVTYGLDERGSILGGGAVFSFFTAASRLTLVPIQPPVKRIPAALTVGLKRPVREADRSPPCSIYRLRTRVTIHPHVFMAYYLVFLFLPVLSLLVDYL
jgi:hypothetical protein